MAFAIPTLPHADGPAARILPIATTLAAMTVTLLPLPVPGYGALAPALTLMAVYHWAIYRPDLLPPAALFLIGLLRDLLVGALPGVSALLLLTAFAVVRRHRRHFVNRPFPFLWAGFLALSVTAMLALWALHCLIDGAVIEFRSAIFRAALTVSLFPAVSFLLGRMQRTLMGGFVMGEHD